MDILKIIPILFPLIKFFHRPKNKQLEELINVERERLSLHQEEVKLREKEQRTNAKPALYCKVHSRGDGNIYFTIYNEGQNSAILTDIELFSPDITINKPHFPIDLKRTFPLEIRGHSKTNKLPLTPFWQLKVHFSDKHGFLYTLIAEGNGKHKTSTEVVTL